MRVLLCTINSPFGKDGDGVSKIVEKLIGLNSPTITLDVAFVSGAEPVRTDMNSVFYKAVPQFTLFKFFTKLTWLLSKEPYPIHSNKCYRNFFIDIISKNHSAYDQIIIVGNFISFKQGEFNSFIEKKISYFPFDSMSLYSKRRYKSSINYINKLLFYFEYKKSLFFESNYYISTNLCFVSELDMRIVRKISNHKDNNFFVIPNGVDININKNNEFNENYKSSIRLIFVGDFRYAPNQDAAIFLMKVLFPNLNKKYNFKLYLVGKHPTLEMQSLSNDSIVVTGYVNDISEYLTQSHIFISPLRFGSGIKNKVLEAMSFGLIVIGSKLSFDGINLKKFSNCILLENETSLIVNQVHNVSDRIDFYSDSRKRSILLMQEEYSWSTTLKRYLSLITNLSNKIDCQ